MAKLTPLPYRYDSLEPTIGEETVREHHDVHQAGYVKGWNRKSKKLEKVRKSPVSDDKSRSDMLRSTYDGLVFNGAGIILHEMYWENLAPIGQGGNPSRQFLSCVDHCFGSIDQMMREMVDVGSAIRGSGWVILAWVPRFRRMVILPVQDHEMRWIPGAVPIIVIDVWEHAYYLNYQAGRRRYLQLLWHNMNWGVVSRRLAEAV